MSDKLYGLILQPGKLYKTTEYFSLETNSVGVYYFADTIFSKTKHCFLVLEEINTCMTYYGQYNFYKVLLRQTLIENFTFLLITEILWLRLNE